MMRGHQNGVRLTSKDRERKRPFAKRDDSTPVACVALSFLHCVSQLGHTRLHRTLLNYHHSLLEKNVLLQKLDMETSSVT